MNTKYYINIWKNEFNKRWQLYKIEETLFEFDEDIILIENYFEYEYNNYINECQYILVTN